MKSRYAFLTVDTEALPNRAPEDHVNRLILGIHGEHRAGVLEMASIGAEFNAPLIFFLDLCGSWDRMDELASAAKSLLAQKQDVQLHAHPEYLPKSFWEGHKLNPRPAFLNQYDEKRTDHILGILAAKFTEITGEKASAFRAGSFRWNASTLKVLKKIGILYSFNNSMGALCMRQCRFSRPTNDIFQWSNGIVEIPVSEKQIFSFLDPPWWARLQYPQSPYFRHRAHWLSWLPGSLSNTVNPAVFLIHSWSFLHRNKKGYEVYVSDRAMNGFRKFLRKLCLDYDIVTSKDLPDLINRGVLTPYYVEDLEKAAI